jgi:hypothetical protein
MTSEGKLDSWKTAAKDLNIKIQSPFYVLTKNEKKLKFDLFVENFGSQKGMIVMSISNMHGLKAVKENGFSFSALNFKRYSIYDRQLFIDTLNDWGYFGDLTKTPEWYTGQPWIK